MMKVVHFYQKTDQMVARYVDVLTDSMPLDVDVRKYTSLQQLRKYIKKNRPDILHLHGCWHFSYWLAARAAVAQGTRVVLSPHGQLEPWVINQHYWGEKLPRILAYQYRLVRSAYALIAMGRMEEGCLRRLNWNPRCETVLNSLITDSLTDDEMSKGIFAVYRKVLDSDQWALMEENTLVAVGGFVKVAQTGDSRWLTDEEASACKGLDEGELRKVVLYTYQEDILEVVAEGMEKMGLEPPRFDPASVPCYYPKNYQRTGRSMLKKDGRDEESKVCELLHGSHKLLKRGKLSMAHIVELAYEIRKCKVDEAKLAERLRERKLLGYASSLMQVLADLMGLEEGFMPIKAVDGRMTNKIETIVTKQLEIK